MNDLSLPIAVGIHQLWYLVPLVVTVSLVYSATRHEEIVPILRNSGRFAAWILGFMAVVLVVLKAIEWLA